MSDLPPPPPPLPPPPDKDASGGSGGSPSRLPYPAAPPHERSDLPPLGPGSLASVLARFGARLLDGLIVSLPLAMYSQKYVTTEGDKFVDNRPLWLVVVTAVVPVLYEFVLIAAFGQTLGKRAAGVIVVRYTDGGHVMPYQAGIRAIVPAIPVLVALALPGSLGQLLALGPALIYLSVLFDPVLRGIHDKAAGTIVLRTGRRMGLLTPR